MLEINNSLLVVVDVQGKLAQLMHEKESLFKNIQILIKAAKLLNIPVISCEQSPDALGHTVPDIAELLTDEKPISKSSFSCCGEGNFNKKINTLNRPQAIICGIETHVCVYQTAADLQSMGKEVFLIADAVSSRTSQNKQIALTRINAMQIKVYSVEMALFELLKTAQHPDFKQVARLIK